MAVEAPDRRSDGLGPLVPPDSQRGSTVAREVRGGLVTFFTMAYIVVLNPLIIGTAKDSDRPASWAAANVVQRHRDGRLRRRPSSPACITIAMGVIGRFPVALAAGLGLNGFVAFTLAPQMTWADAMGLVVIEGVIIARAGAHRASATAVFHAVPEQLKYAIGVGIGLFITIIGLVDAGIARPGVPAHHASAPTARCAAGRRSSSSSACCCSRCSWPSGSRARSSSASWRRRSSPIVIEAVAQVGPRVGPDGEIANELGWSLNVPTLPDARSSRRRTSGCSATFNLLRRLPGASASIAAIARGLLAHAQRLLRHHGHGVRHRERGRASSMRSGDVPHLEAILLVDSVAAAAGGAASVVEQHDLHRVGVRRRRGCPHRVSPRSSPACCSSSRCSSRRSSRSIPHEAATPALVIVGFLMMTQIRHIDFTDYSIGIPAFLTLTIMPFTYSITNGIGAGFVSWTPHPGLRRARPARCKPLMWVVTAAFVVYFAYDPISTVLGVA
ncbi:MAG: NCS2 family permease [Dermatophilaceae bacterium]